MLRGIAVALANYTFTADVDAVGALSFAQGARLDQVSYGDGS